MRERATAGHGNPGVLRLPLTDSRAAPLTVLCLGAHCDDIEIGCGGTVLRMIREFPSVRVWWVTLSSSETRKREAEAAGAAFLSGAEHAEIVIHGFRDGFFPYLGLEIKEAFEDMKQVVTPDIVFTHYRSDAHQDHRLVSDLTWNTFRNHLILEYEIPKYDGDLGSPNFFVELARPDCERKIEHLMACYETQRDKGWFSTETFWGLLRLRGIEAASESGFAEGFYCRKLVV